VNVGVRPSLPENVKMEVCLLLGSSAVPDVPVVGMYFEETVKEVTCETGLAYPWGSYNVDRMAETKNVVTSKW
jgi:hypothetical protein